MLLKIKYFLALFFFQNILYSITNEPLKIAILPFKDSSIDRNYSNFVQSMPDMIMTNLAKSRNIILVERNQIDKALEHFAIEMSGLIDDKNAIQIGNWLGANKIILGNFIAIGKDVRIDVRVVDIKYGIITKTTNISGKVDELFKIIDDLSLKIYDLFEVSQSNILYDDNVYVTYNDAKYGKEIYEYKDPIIDKYSFKIKIKKCENCGCMVNFNDGSRNYYNVGFDLYFNDDVIANPSIEGYGDDTEVLMSKFNKTNLYYDIEVVIYEMNYEWLSIGTEVEFFGACEHKGNNLFGNKIQIFSNGSIHLKITRKKY